MKTVKRLPRRPRTDSLTNRLLSHRPNQLRNQALNRPHNLRPPAWNGSKSRKQSLQSTLKATWWLKMWSSGRKLKILDPQRRRHLLRATTPLRPPYLNSHKDWNSLLLRRSRPRKQMAQGRFNQPLVPSLRLSSDIWLIDEFLKMKTIIWFV